MNNKIMAGRILNKEKTKRLPFPVLGKIKCGYKEVSSNGREYPKSCDWFIPSGKYASLFTQAYGEKPSTIQVVFPSNDPELVCNEEYTLRDSAGKLVASGDGETFKVFSPKTNAYITLSTEQYPNLMESLSAKYPNNSGWKVTLTLNFLIPTIRGVMGVWQFQTKGEASSIPSIRDAFDAVLEANGHADGVIFDLSVKMAKSGKPNTNSKYPVVSLVVNESLENLKLMRECKKPLQISD